MKLSKTQLEVLQLMNNGWELGYTFRAWLQKNGIGCGGEAKDVKINTFFALQKKKVIEVNKKPHFHTTTYKLTEEAKELLKEEQNENI